MNHFHMDAIIKYLQDMGEASVKDIADHCGVTLPTARKYLVLMHEEKLLVFSRGRAERMPQNYATVLGWRMWESKEEKKAIGKAAASFVKDGETIFIGGGSTVVCMLDYLEKCRNLTVITNSIYVINKLLLMPNIHIICMGGDWNPGTNTFSGNISSIYQGLFPHRAFFGAVGINIEKGVMQSASPTDQDELIMAERAKTNYILADHSKFEIFEPWMGLASEKIKNIITDKSFSAEELLNWKKIGVNIVSAPINN
ncbi:MAG: DeoR/GlpR family DNA-binding transcription regulator [Brevinema sp.]